MPSPSAPFPVSATGTVTVISPLAGDNVTINGLQYTGVAGTKSDNTEFTINGGNTAIAADLADSINNDTRTGTLGTVSATSALSVVTLTSSQEGTAGNSVTLATSSATTLTISGATFSGGVDATPNVYALTFNDEDISVIDTINRPALSSRRLVDVQIVPNSQSFTVRSAVAALRQVDKFEDAVAETGNGAEGDGTYTNVRLRGVTPFETFIWDFVKLGNVYTVTATANS